MLKYYLNEETYLEKDESINGFYMYEIVNGNKERIGFFKDYTLEQAIEFLEEVEEDAECDAMMDEKEYSRM